MFIASLIAMATRQPVHLNIMVPAKKIAAAQKYFSFPLRLHKRLIMMYEMGNDVLTGRLPRRNKHSSSLQNYFSASQ